VIDQAYDFLISPFSEFMFLRRALVASLALALGCAPVGVFLVLRRMSLMGDALSHSILPGAAIGYVIGGLSLTIMSLGGLLAGLLVSLLAGGVTRLTPLKEDASFVGFYLISLALGVLIVAAYGSNVDLMHVLFGTILSVDPNSLRLIAGVTSITLITLSLAYRPLILECFDSIFTQSQGIPGGRVHFMFMTLVVLNMVAAFHALGTLMALGLMMLPAVSAKFWSQEISKIIIISVGVGAFSGYGGLLLSYHYTLPSGPSIVLVAGVFYTLSLIFGSQGGLWHLRRSGP
jgi:zinc/manganese transport system permease protein